MWKSDEAASYCFLHILKKITSGRFSQTYNLGTGQGFSVLQLVKAFEAVTDTKVAYDLKPRREGDIVSMFANTTLAKKELGWTAKYSLENMCKSTSINPQPQSCFAS